MLAYASLRANDACSLSFQARKEKAGRRWARPHLGYAAWKRQAQLPAAARSANQMTSPMGRMREAGKLLSPDRILSRMSRLPSPATRNATTALESSAG